MLGFTPNEDALTAELIDRNIEPGDSYDTANLPALRLAAIKLIELLLSTANTSNASIGYLVSYDRDAVIKRLEMLKRDAGLSSNTIKSINFW